MMGTSVYSWVLNLIRLGKGQVQSWNMTQQRFQGESQEAIQNSWLGAWAGRFTALFMEDNPSYTFYDTITEPVIGGSIPAIDARPDVIRRWLLRTVEGPFDIVMTTETTVGEFVEYGTWRFGAGDEDTYNVWVRTTAGIIVKEYLRGEKGKTKFLTSYIIGQPLP